LTDHRAFVRLVAGTAVVELAVAELRERAYRRPPPGGSQNGF
jgi:hypothetical protein